MIKELFYIKELSAPVPSWTHRRAGVTLAGTVGLDQSYDVTHGVALPDWPVSDACKAQCRLV